MNRFMGSGLVMIVVYMLFSSFGKPVYGTPIAEFNYTATRAAGGSVTGLFGYDLGVLDSLAPNNVGYYSGAGSWSGTVTGGPQDGISFSFSGIDTRITDNAASPNFDSIAIAVGFPSPSFTFINLIDVQATVFSNDSLPLDIVLADYEARDLRLNSGDVGDPSGQTSYVFQSINVVPIPATIALLGLGYVGLAGGAARRKWKKKAVDKS